MLGLFGIFGRAREIQTLDHALRRVDLHPALVPDAVKLAIVRQVKAAEDGGASEAGLDAAARLVAYCMMGSDAFAAANEPALATAAEDRIAAALDAGDSLDARLVMLTLHAGVIQPEVVDRFGLTMAGTD